MKKLTALVVVLALSTTSCAEREETVRYLARSEPLSGDRAAITCIEAEINCYTQADKQCGGPWKIVEQSNDSSIESHGRSGIYGSNGTLSGFGRSDTVQHNRWSIVVQCERSVPQKAEKDAVPGQQVDEDQLVRSLRVVDAGARP